MSWIKIPTKISITEVAGDVDFNVSGGKDGAVSVIMRFTHVRDGMAYDVQVKFRRSSVFSYRCLDEAFPDKMDNVGETPTIDQGKFPKGRFPILQTTNSPWLESIADIFQDRRFPPCKHYLFTSLNDIVEVLASEEPTLEIVK